MSQERNVLFPRLGPTFPGPIGDTKAGLMKRYSFMTIETGEDGITRKVRKYHPSIQDIPRSDVSGLQK